MRLLGAGRGIGPESISKLRGGSGITDVRGSGGGFGVRLFSFAFGRGCRGLPGDCGIIPSDGISTLIGSDGIVDVLASGRAFGVDREADLDRVMTTRASGWLPIVSQSTLAYASKTASDLSSAIATAR
jgi:hypothetical protein